MRKLVFLFIFTVSLAGLFAQSFKMPADTEFFYLYGGANPDVARCIKETPDGGYIIAGTSSSFGPGDASVYLVKTDSLGKHLWSATYGGHQNDWGYSVEVTADSGYFVAGYSNSFNPPNGYDAYYFKTDKNGNLQWEKTISGADWDFIYGSVAMPGGGFILCGETYTNSNGGTDAYLIRIDANGNTLWAKNYGGLFDETFNSVAIMNNQIYAVGKNATHATDTIADGWIVKLDTNGNVLKDIFITNPYNHFEEIILGITPYTNNTFHFCGKINQLDNNSVTPIIGRADTSLNIIFNFMDGPIPAGNIEIFSHVINISYGSICLVGTKLAGFGNLGMHFVGFDQYATFINDYARTVGGAKEDYGYDGIYTSKGKVIGVGSTLSNQDYCSTSNLGLEDFFVVRFNCDSILNGPLTPLTKTKYNCFVDTLYLWQISIKTYAENINVKLFPNPATEKTQLEINCNEQKIYVARLYSLLGSEVATFKVSSNTYNNLDLSKVSDGSYFLKLQDENENNLSVLKFIIAK